MRAKQDGRLQCGWKPTTDTQNHQLNGTRILEPLPQCDWYVRFSDYCKSPVVCQNRSLSQLSRSIMLASEYAVTVLSGSMIDATFFQDQDMSVHQSFTITGCHCSGTVGAAHKINDLSAQSGSMLIDIANKLQASLS